jgi:hypothetical protein
MKENENTLRPTPGGPSQTTRYTRTGKIARLPRHLRDQLNLRLDNGLPAKPILALDLAHRRQIRLDTLAKLAELRQRAHSSTAAPAPPGPASPAPPQSAPCG